MANISEPELKRFVADLFAARGMASAHAEALGENFAIAPPHFTEAVKVGA